MDAWEETTGMRRAAATEERSETQPKKSSVKSMQDEVDKLAAKVAPPSAEEIMVELGRCLRLTVPSGMSQDERKEWLRVAYLEVRDVPNCEFFNRCAHARKVADHPAKIIPKMFEYKPTHDSARIWKDLLATERAKLENAGRALLGSFKPEYCTPEQAAKIKAELGFDEPLPAPDLSASRPYAAARKLRMPTEEELAEIARTMGTPS